MSRLDIYSRNNQDIMIFSIIIMIKLVACNFILGISGIGYYTLFGCLGSTLFFVGISLVLEGKSRARFLLICNIVFSFAIYLNVLVNRCYGDIFTSGIFFHSDFMEILGKIFLFPRIYDIFIFLDIFIIIYLMRKGKIYSKNKINKYSILKLILVSGFGIFLCYISTTSLNKSQPGILKNFYDKKTIVKEAGLANYGVVDLISQINKAKGSNEVIEVNNHSNNMNEVVEFFDKKPNESPKYKGIAEGKNLIVIQLEAFQSFLLNRSINGVEITPNLNKLSKESVNFNNCYVQIGAGGTSDAEFLTNTSLLPLSDKSVYTDYSGNTYESLPKKLKEKGYYTSVMHANRPGFWNRYLMYRSLGFDVFESELSFNLDEKLILGLSDESFFNQAIGKMKSYKQPFYSFMISLTSHYPFMDTKGKLNGYMNVSDLEGTVTGNMIKSARYTDEMLGKFLEKLKQEGLYDNSIIAIYGDHGGVSIDRKGELAKLLYGSDTMTNLQWEEAQKVVSMIHIPGSNIKGEVNAVAGQYDMYPTLANLLNIDNKYTLGRDLLNSKNGFAVNSAGSIFNDDAIYIAEDDKVYSRKDGSVLNKKDYFNLFNKREVYYDLSEHIIKCNLLKNLK
ncbi:MAG: LTA synthase family protein [Clostridium sp.]|uniref:LTA synthase family protein n=1 Tax=Clostridium sp. TaxID=1506 RepID=UPI002FC65837